MHRECCGGSRRRFLKLLGGVSALGALSACSSASSSPESFGDAAAGNVSDLAVGSLRAVSGAPAFIGRDEQGVYAMTSTCTHEGCDLIGQGSIDNSVVSCHCHGARYDLQGNVLGGPAKSALQHFAVSVDSSGALTVHGGTPVAESVRTSVV